MSKKLENLDIDKNEEPVIDTNTQDTKANSPEQVNAAEEPTENDETVEKQEQNDTAIENYSSLNFIDLKKVKALIFHHRFTTFKIFFMKLTKKHTH